MTPLLVLHDVGDERTACNWRDALDDGAWIGGWLAADLPDHDYYDPADLVMVALRWLRECAWSAAPVVIAIGQQAVVGEFLALGGRASGLVLVDATPVLDVGPDEGQRHTYEWMRAVADDPGQHNGLPPMTDAAWAERQRAAIAVPVLELDGAEPARVLASVRSWWDSGLVGL